MRIEAEHFTAIEEDCVLGDDLGPALICSTGRMWPGWSPWIHLMNLEEVPALQRSRSRWILRTGLTTGLACLGSKRYSRKDQDFSSSDILQEISHHILICFLHCRSSQKNWPFTGRWYQLQDLSKNCLTPSERWKAAPIRFTFFMAKMNVPLYVFTPSLQTLHVLHTSPLFPAPGNDFVLFNQGTDKCPTQYTSKISCVVYQKTARISRCGIFGQTYWSITFMYPSYSTQ